MMAYLLWRVERKKSAEIEMNFLLAGHTKFSCDMFFGMLKKWTRRTKLSSLAEIKDVCLDYNLTTCIINLCLESRVCSFA